MGANVVAQLSSVHPLQAAEENVSKQDSINGLKLIYFITLVREKCFSTRHANVT